LQAKIKALREEKIEMENQMKLQHSQVKIYLISHSQEDLAGRRKTYFCSPR